MTSTAIARRLVGASGITSSCGGSQSGRGGIVVQTGIVRRIYNRVFSIAAGSNSSIVVPDDEEMDPSGDIDSPIEASTCDIVTRKWTLRDDEGSAAWDGAVKADGST
jgi:hypothetical protein